MAKTIELSFSFPVNAGAIRSKLQQLDELERIASASGAPVVSVSVDGNVTTVVRNIEAPANARAFLKTDVLEVVEKRIWGQTGAEIEITVTDQPLRMTGHIEFTEHGANCVMRVNGTVEAHMGIASPLAEGVLRERLIQAIHSESEALA